MKQLKACGAILGGFRQSLWNYVPLLHRGSCAIWHYIVFKLSSWETVIVEWSECKNKQKLLDIFFW